VQTPGSLKSYAPWPSRASSCGSLVPVVILGALRVERIDAYRAAQFLVRSFVRCDRKAIKRFLAITNG
jgi:hypothetical protein